MGLIIYPTFIGVIILILQPESIYCEATALVMSIDKTEVKEAEA